jgi:hypothetical protein
MPTGSGVSRAVALLAAATLAVSACSSDDSGGGATEQESSLRVEVVSSRAEYVTGGNALVAVTADDPDGVTVELDGEDVTAGFAPDPDDEHRLVGLVDGLPDGDATITAAQGDDTADVKVTNYPDQGPVFSGDQVPLVLCTTDSYGLAASTPDEGCLAEPKVSWEYVDTAGNRKPFPDPEQVPADAEQIDGTEAGTKVPFVIRTELGVLNRSVYRIETVEQSWNKRLVYRFGGGCGATFTQGFIGTGPTALELLRRGYATATASFNTYQVLCNDVISGETASIVKEHFVETYGEPTFTIGEGGSGGAIQQIMLAQNYPGLLDAIAPTVPFPDAFSISGGVFDCALLVDYYATPAGAALTDAQRQAINGHATAGTCGLWDITFAPGLDPTAGCQVDLASAFPGAGGAGGLAPPIPPEMIYDPDTNPDGLRCTVWETNAAVTGRDPDTGFANSGYDNTGVQYGLDALNEGVLTPDQFLDLNEKVGGFDGDGQPRPDRSAVDPELMERAFATGRVSGPWGGLPDTPIILVNVFTDPLGDIHDRVRSFELLDRLADDDGNPPPTVSLWTINPKGSTLVETLTGALGDFAMKPTFALDAWLTAATSYQADHDDVSWRVALAETKPEEAESRCLVKQAGAAADDVDEIVGPDAQDDPACKDAYPISQDPRMAAGAPRSGDVLKCQLIPVDEAEDLYEVDLTSAQMDRLAEIFPDGVCDYSKRSVGYGEPSGPWQSLN